MTLVPLFLASLFAFAIRIQVSSPGHWHVASNASSDVFYTWRDDETHIIRHSNNEAATIEIGQLLIGVECEGDAADKALIQGYYGWFEVLPRSDSATPVDTSGIERLIRVRFPGRSPISSWVCPEFNLAYTTTVVKIDDDGSPDKDSPKAEGILSNLRPPIVGMRRTDNTEYLKPLQCTASKVVAKNVAHGNEILVLTGPKFEHNLILQLPRGATMIRVSRDCESLYYWDAQVGQAFKQPLTVGAHVSTLGPNGCTRFWIGNDSKVAVFEKERSLLILKGGALIKKYVLNNRAIRDVGVCKSKVVAISDSGLIEIKL